MVKSPLAAQAELLKREWRRFNHCFLNLAFVLDKRGAATRRRILTIAVFAVWLLLGMKNLLGSEWRTYLADFFNYALNSSSETDPASFAALLKTLALSFFSPVTLRLIPVFVAPYLLALDAASNYLANVFELDDQSIAREFINRAAFGSQYETLLIKDGAVAEKDKQSPLSRIGGPGLVKVDLHSVALFEKPNGRPHVIGPTVQANSGENVLEGFERLRAALDLRDIVIGPINVSERTQDGIKVTAEDVRMVFSIWRGATVEERTPTRTRAYPFRKDAVPSLVYRQTCHGEYADTARTACADWIESMRAGIVAEMKNFITQHKLSDFLTSVGEPEIRILNERIHKLQKNEEAVPVPNFYARDEITGRFPRFTEEFENLETQNLFSEFARAFTENNRQNGVELGWLGIGTWKPPDRIIPEKNMAAWILSKENAAKGSPASLAALEKEEKRKEFLHYVQKVPLSSSRLSAAPNAYRSSTLRKTLIDYRELIKTARTLLPKYADAEAETLAERFTQAIETINANLAHFPSENYPLG
jgi:hypothetical protein